MRDNKQDTRLLFKQVGRSKRKYFEYIILIKYVNNKTNIPVFFQF